MTLEAKFSLEKKDLEARFGAIQTASDGGYDRGFAEGQKAEYDRFWDAFQQNGTRTDYENAFRLGWTDENFNPKYPLRPTISSFMFGIGCGITEIKAGVLDLSLLTTLKNMFYNNAVTVKIPPLDVSTIKLFNSPFYGCKIDTLVLENVQEDCELGTWTAYGALKNFSMTGTIGKSFSLHTSWQLTNESVQSVIDHLKDGAGQTLTFYKAVGKNLTDAQKAIITAKNWTLVY